MPALSPTMKEGKLIKWFKKEGDKINPGDVLAEIETDKATMEVEAVDQGILSKILIKDGTDKVKVNEAIAIINNGSDDEEKDNKDVEKKEENKDEILELETTQKKQKIKKHLSTEISANVTTQHKEITAYKNLENITVREAINSAISEEMKIDKNVFFFNSPKIP